MRSIGVMAALALVVTAASANAQPVGVDVKPPARTKPTPLPTPQKLDPKNLTAEQVAEVTIIAYGVRERLDQVRKTTFEVGTISNLNAEGKMEQSKYQRFILRGNSLAKEKIRLDQDTPSARYSLLYNDQKITGLYNNTPFTPREDVARSFEDQIVHGIDALLRYKENGSTLALAPRDKIMGVEYIVIDLTDKEGRKTRFYVSAKLYRVMMLTYDEGGVQYRRKFYDYNYAQGTLVPFRTVLWAGDKQVEESEIGTVTFGQKVDEGLFSVG